MSNQIETSFQVQLDNRDRATAFARLILVFPVFLFLSSFSIETFFNENMLQTYGLVILPVVLALLFRGVYPSYVLSFNKAIFGLVNRIWAYIALLTDEYPSIKTAAWSALHIQRLMAERALAVDFLWLSGYLQFRCTSWDLFTQSTVSSC